MNHLQLTILNRLSKGPAIAPQLWLNAQYEEKKLLRDTIDGLVRSGHVIREDRGRSMNWYFYSLSETGAKSIKGEHNED